MVPSYVLILHTSCEVRGPYGPQAIMEAVIKTCGRGVYGAYGLAEWPGHSLQGIITPAWDI